MDGYGPGATGVDGEAVGAAMRLARRRLGLSQRALAEALSWDRAKVGRWENGAVSEGFEEVVAILKVLGFEVVLTDPAADRWADMDDPAEHVLDRADRRFPAHLELCAENTSSTCNWTRHRGEPSPKASQTSFRRRTQVEVLAEAAGRRAVPRTTPEAGGSGQGSTRPAP
ncbi:MULTISPECIES: helix-turn-helix domain-containing protein [unclassified Knoellia]|uniref:helix-turn-helix domain-containing protein n=1 Tax=Knoellia altitudinis TaxID=3404795 RepID=UPI00361953A0